MFESIIQRIESIASSLDLEIIHLEVEKTRRIQCIIDRDPEGVTLQDCTRLSRAVSRALDEENLDAESFHLEVMSPGVNRLLTREKDFTRFKGERVQIILKKKLDGRKNFVGILLGLEHDTVAIHLQEPDEEMTFLRSEIKEARLYGARTKSAE